MNKHFKALEFDKILLRLADYTSCPDARELALSLRPEHNLASRDEAAVEVRGNV